MYSVNRNSYSSWNSSPSPSPSPYEYSPSPSSYKSSPSPYKSSPSPSLSPYEYSASPVSSTRRIPIEPSPLPPSPTSTLPLSPVNTVNPSPSKVRYSTPSNVYSVTSPDKSAKKTPKISPSRPSVSRQTPRKSTPQVSESIEDYSFPAGEEPKVTVNVEDILIVNGYKPIKHITVDNEQNKNFILATNKRGQYVLINLNGNNPSVIGKILHTEQIKGEESDIPYSLRKGSLECSNGVCGVAYEGDRRLVTITRDNLSLDAKSETLVYKGDNIVTIGNNIPIPIVNYSDIVYDPEGILYNTCETTKRLYAKAYENCKIGLSDTLDEFRTLGDALKDFISSEDVMSANLGKSMLILNNIATQYEQEPPNNDKEQRSYELTKLNLRKRNDLFIILVNCCNEISAMKNDIIAMTQRVREIEEMCEREFSGVDKIMTL